MTDSLLIEELFRALSSPTSNLVKENEVLRQECKRLREALHRVNRETVETRRRRRTDFSEN